ncbi:MAG TPA: transcriptional regulator [Gemmatimonadaceae bacterium]|nr:transcriptional regulator [Gemmatimonadaceae bacterium]
MADSNTARRRRTDAGAEPAQGRPLGSVRAVAGAAAAQEESRALDALIHHRMRLGIVSALAAEESLTFNELKALLRTTDGNLSVHARKLEEAQYVVVTKRFEGRRPRTEYRLTTSGRKALQRYLDHMEALIRATRDTLQR